MEENELLFLPECKMDINFKYKNILEDLYSSPKGLQLYSLYRRYRFEPSEALDFIQKYEPQGIICIDSNSIIRLSESGRVNFRNIISEIYKNYPKQEKSYLMEIRYEPISMYSPYIPLSLLKEEPTTF